MTSLAGPWIPRRMLAMRLIAEGPWHLRGREAQDEHIGLGLADRLGFPQHGAEWPWWGVLSGLSAADAAVAWTVLAPGCPPVPAVLPEGAPLVPLLACGWRCEAELDWRRQPDEDLAARVARRAARHGLPPGVPGAWWAAWDCWTEETADAFMAAEHADAAADARLHAEGEALSAGMAGVAIPASHMGLAYRAPGRPVTELGALAPYPGAAGSAA